MLPKVFAVVLAYNNYGDTAECLRSLRAATHHPLGVIVVDNGSTDGTASRLMEEFPEVTVVSTGSNLGVAGGFNAGVVPALQAGADYVLILNNDTIVAPDMPALLVQAAQSDLDIAILMPKILYEGDRGRIWSAGAQYRRFPPAIVMRGLDQADDGRFDTSQPIEFAPTCGLLLSRHAFERVGLFDDGYFFYFDDWDFSLRTRRAGLKIWFVPAARLYHKVSRTIQQKGRPPFFWRTWGASGARFYHRFGHPAVLSALWHLGYLALREGSRNGLGSVVYFVQGVIAGWRKPLSITATLPGKMRDE
jgi:hypothetical protein